MFQKVCPIAGHSFIKAAIYQVCHSEERSDVGISSSALQICTELINIDNPKYTMLIGAAGIERPVLEIPTSGLRPSSE